MDRAAVPTSPAFVRRRGLAFALSGSPADLRNEIDRACRDFVEESNFEMNLPSAELKSILYYPKLSNAGRNLSNTQEFAICLETKPLVLLMKQCGHAKACSSRLHENFVTQAHQDVSNYPLRCFFLSCHRIVTTNT